MNSAARTSCRFRPPSQGSIRKKSPPSKVSHESLWKRRRWREAGTPAEARRRPWSSTNLSKSGIEEDMVGRAEEGSAAAAAAVWPDGRRRVGQDRKGFKLWK